jgi:hypothetical protein
MDWLKDQHCVACDWFIDNGLVVDPAHTVNNGGASKGPDSSCVPLCRRHHDEMDGRLNTKVVTKAQFAAKYKLDLAAIAAAHFARYQAETGT